MGFMKTEQEQAQAMAELITNKDLLDDKGRLAGKVVFGADQLAVALVNAGYGDVSEYKAEIERLRTTLGQCNTELNSALESLKSQCREIGKLKAGNKQAKIDVLNKAKERAVGLAAIETYHICNLIDKIIKEVQDE